MKTIEEQLMNLESRVRRQRFGMIGLSLGLAGAFFLGMTQAKPTGMSVESLTITKDGTPRIVLGTNTEDGGVGIGFLDPAGKPRIVMGTDSRGDGGMAVMDKNAATKIVIGSGPEGNGIMLIDATLTEVPSMPNLPGVPK